MLKEKRIPTILGLFLLLGSLFAGTFLTSQEKIFVSKASVSCQPKNPQITNLTDTSAVVFFTTESSCLSTLSINNNIFENQAVIANGQKSKLHYFDIVNLDPAFDYVFSPIVDGEKYTNPAYAFKTALVSSSSIPSSNLAWGRVFNSEFKAAQKAVVFVNIPGAFPLSALVTSSGNWSISLANSFNDSKTNRFSPSPNINEEIIVIDQDNNITQITGNTSNNDPTPDIILGQNQFSPITIVYDTKTDTGYLPSIDPLPATKELEILNPKDNDTLSTQKPDFFGTGPVDSVVKIEVHSPTLHSGEVVVSKDGSWNWSPPSDLEPGEHTITATTIVDGVQKIITRKFVVLAVDNPLSYTASPSATTPTPPKSSTPTTTPKVITTPTPSPPLTTTPTVTITPTATPTAIIKSTTPSTSSGVPTTGTSIPTVILLLTSSSLIFFSFYFLNKKTA